MDYHIPYSISLILFDKHNVKSLFICFRQAKKILLFKKCFSKTKKAESYRVTLSIFICIYTIIILIEVKQLIIPINEIDHITFNPKIQ